MSGADTTFGPEGMHRAQQRWRMPEGAREILLIRHGASVGATVDTIELGSLTISDPLLSEEGEAQAEALGQHLANLPISALFVTPLRRTQQTAAPLAAALGLTPTVVEELREVHLGDWEHSFYVHASSGHPLLKEMMVKESFEVIPNAERSADFAARIKTGIERIIAATEPGSISAAFSHAGVIADLCRQATDSRAFAFTAPENTSVTRLIVSSNGHWKLRSFNDVTHLGY